MTDGSGDDLVGAFYRAYNAGDTAAAAELYAEDGWHQEGLAGPRREGRSALTEGLNRFLGMLPDAHWAVRETIPSGNAVAVVYTLTGKLGIDIGGKPTKGLPIELPGIHLFDLVGGKIAGTRDFWDFAAFKQQLDVVAA